MVEFFDFGVKEIQLRQRTIRLLGFEPAPSDPILSAIGRLLGHGLDEDIDGVLALEIDGVCEYWVFRTDPEDGYRSSLAPVYIAPMAGCILQFESDPIPVVIKCEAEDRPNGGSNDFICVVGKDDNHMWFYAGTDYGCTYYPVSVVEWQPKEPSAVR